MVTVAGNPVSSAPNVERLDAAFSSLDFMVAVDFYVNETTRHAHVILPPPSPLERDHYDLALYQLSIRNFAKYSPPVFERAAGRPDEWEILLTLRQGPDGHGRAAPSTKPTTSSSPQLAAGEIGEDGGRWSGLTVSEAMAELAAERRSAPPARPAAAHGSLRRRIRTQAGRAYLAEARSSCPTAVDLGPLKPQLPSVLRTPDERIDLAPPTILADLPAPPRSDGCGTANL